MTTMQVLRQLPGRPGAGQPRPTGRRGRAVPPRIAFWLVALVLTVTMLGTTLPTPLYVIYQGRWHFSAAMVTVTFAVYAAAVMAALLLAGRSSDQAGRRPVLAVALGASALSTAGFILAPGVAANRLAPAGRRGQSISAFFLACYAGLIIPVVGVGVLSVFTGTFAATATFSILLAALSLFSVARFARIAPDDGGR